MPKLLVFAACEKALGPVGSDEGSSLIALLDRLVLKLEVPLADNDEPTVPVRWYVVAIWQWRDEDAGKLYEQRVRLRYPDGTYRSGVAPELDIKGQMQRNPPHARRATATLRIDGFPAKQTGEYLLELSLRPGGGEWEEKASYPIIVAHSIE